jgi:hypothetical protein
VNAVLYAAVAVDAAVFIAITVRLATLPHPKHRMTRATARRSRITLRGAAR